MTTTVHVFTYGTLRPGHYNARLFDGCVLSAETATVEGFKLYANQGGSYPYLVADDTATTPVTGTLYLLDADATTGFIRAHHMELGAGYDFREVVVTVAEDGREVDALVWDWRRPEWLGEFIPSGDWEVFEKSARPRFLPTTRGI